MVNISKYVKGSEWRKWDLHFHTPSSYDYKNGAITNKDIIEKLKKSKISVVAVTDHHVIDVARVSELQKLGKIEDITVFPGIEFCSESRGRDPIHFIGIFPEDSDVNFVWNEINSKADIATQRQNGKKDNEIHCELKKTCKLIKRLGGVVSIHAGTKSNTIENITNSLPVRMAEKTDIVKIIDIFELGKPEDQKDYNEKVFPKIKQILPMIICSDNHNVSKYILKENCWIKADPSFEGLKQIIYEPKDRVFIGAEPAVLTRVRSNKTKYIKSLTIKNKKGRIAKTGKWFQQVELNFNSELVAIIGNKGSGKSAISDIIGVLGDTRNAGEGHKNLTFLNNIPKLKKFRQKGFADAFEATMSWEDGSSVKDSLDKTIDRTKTEKVKYLPQNYFESLTNDLEGEGFENTVKSVIFLHIPKSERHGKSTFEALEKYKSSSLEKDLQFMKAEIEEASEEIIKLEKRNHPTNKERIENLLKEKEKELVEHKKIIPDEVKDPSIAKEGGVDKEKERQIKTIEALNVKLSLIDDDISFAQDKKHTLVSDKEVLQQISNDLTRFSTQLKDYKKQNKKRFKKAGFDIDVLIKTEIDPSRIDVEIKMKDIGLAGLNVKLRTIKAIDRDFKNGGPDYLNAMSGSLFAQKKVLEEKITAVKKDLSKPEREFQTYKEELTKWENKRAEIEGDSKSPKSILSTIAFYTEEKRFIDSELIEILKKKRTDRTDIALEIFNKKKEILDLYKEFKISIDEKIGEDKEFRKKFKMDIDVSFKESINFSSKFLDFINQGKAGTFYGKIDGAKYLSKIFGEMNLSDVGDVRKILDAIMKYMEYDQREKQNETKREVSDQVDQVSEFYRYIYSLEYLEPSYQLKLDDKVLEELSPGEKGAVLLVFYLMIDKEDTPLIIDQPEDNLDNKSVFEVLTHFIKYAKKNRQIIIVTHNPNLAVGADAEQIIYVHLDKQKEHEFTYLMGAIENPKLNKRIVDILEGTQPAFDKRKLKYLD